VIRYFNVASVLKLLTNQRDTFPVSSDFPPPRRYPRDAGDYSRHERTN